MVEVLLSRLPHAEGLELPLYETAGAAGMDLRAALSPTEVVMLAPGARAAIPTGLRIAVPHGFEAQVRPRSGLALRSGVTALNSPGTIDSDYRGEIKVILVNLGAENFGVRRGDRIAQLVFAPVVQGQWREGSDIGVTDRGEAGFGSTGRI